MVGHHLLLHTVVNFSVEQSSPLALGEIATEMLEILLLRPIGCAGADNRLARSGEQSFTFFHCRPRTALNALGDFAHLMHCELCFVLSVNALQPLSHSFFC